ncbi:MAG: hypothetical protein WCW16_05045 [Candidatus Magasanikbacteria bacterium]
MKILEEHIEVRGDRGVRGHIVGVNTELDIRVRFKPVGSENTYDVAFSGVQSGIGSNDYRALMQARNRA